MDYTNTGVSMAAIGGGTLAYTGAENYTLWVVVAMLMIAIGLAMAAKSSWGKYRDAKLANVGPQPRRNFFRRIK